MPDNPTPLPRTLDADECRVIAETLRMRAVATQDRAARSFLLALAGVAWRGAAAGGYDLLLRPAAEAGEGAVERVPWQRWFRSGGAQ